MKHQRIPTWLLERVALGEVPPERADEVRERIERDPDAQARLAELERSNAEILADLPPAQVAAEVARRAAAASGSPLFAAVRPPNGRSRMQPRRRMFALASSVAVAAGAVLIAVAVGRQVGWPGPGATQGGAGDGPAVGEHPAATDDPSGDGTRVKGPPRLVFHRKRGSRTERLDSTRDRVRAGDRIQILYFAGDAREGAAHGVILSIDGAGTVTRHFPVRAGGSTLLEHAGVVSLDHSYELDDAPGFERFLLLTSPQPIDVAAVTASAENLARNPQHAVRDLLPLPPSLAQRWYTLRKEATP